ncbi:hypothetical protein FQR65_LT06916 [Abscondita terminalis]|nr:hypothetical protein FQR65_LT06916 [Abscondita terminalis]
MSTSNQSTVKKNNSTNNSITNTPSSTPISTIANSVNTQAPVQSTTPPNNAPKYGTLVPNRIFVGGISANTTEAELLQLFSNYGTVKAAKIIQDRAGVSKGYGFVTFESEEDAKRLQREADNIVLRERKLNIAPAIKKQPFSRAFDASSPPTITPGAPAPYFIPAGSMPFYQSGMAYYSQAPQPGDPNTQQAPVYPSPAVYPAQSGPPQTAAYPSIVYPTQPLYMPQQFPYQPVPYDYSYYPNGGPQYMVGNQNTSQPQGHSMQRPGSPPRTPCFNTPMPYGAETMYFNMPMYDGSLEATTVYQESLDMANGNINEDAYGYFGNAPNDLEPPEPSDTNSVQEYSNASSVDGSRQSNTPVVSVLSLDQHQERDLTSLQGGRRRKSAETIPSINNIHDYNKHMLFVPYENNFINANRSHNAPPQSNNSSNNFNGSLPTPSPVEFGGSKQNPHLCNGGNERTWYNKKRNYTKYADETQSQNDTTVDENRNEDKNCRSPPQLLFPPPTPPPPPISANKYPPRNYQNNIRSQSHMNHNNFRYGGVNKGPPRNFPLSKGLTYYNGYKTPNFQTRDVKLKKKYGEENVLYPPSAELSDVNLNSLPPQMPSSIASFNFIPPARRGGRRTVRRGPSTSSANQIGAGDAPLPSPSSDVSDSCKMLDNLKL